MIDETTLIDTDIKVEKRNGIVTGFKLSRISNAVGNAFKQIDSLPREVDLPEVAAKHVEKVTLAVYNVLKDRAKAKNPLSVEDIQDEVIRQLYENGYKEVAEIYAGYRRNHAARRTIFDLYKVTKRDGKVVSFKPEKIAMAIAKAFQAANKDDSVYRPLEKAKQLADDVVNYIKLKWPEGHTIDIEDLQDIVEETLMNSGYFQVARRYIVYREERRQDRATKKPKEETSYSWAKDIEYITQSGEKKKLDIEELRHHVESCCDGLSDTEAEPILKESLKNYYNGITDKQIAFSNLMATRVLIEKEPNYSFVAARLLLLHGYQEAMGHKASFSQMKVDYPTYFVKYVPEAVKYELISKEMLDYDLNYLAKHLKPERDFQFKYLGIQTLYDRYFLHWEERRIEIPQIFWMRVAMGLAINEENREERAVEFYNLLSSFQFVSSTPTLFNAGTRHPQLSSCYLTTIEDDLHHIFKCIQDDAMLSKWSGGLGNDWTNVRAMGTRIKGTNGKSQGIVPFLKVANDTAVAVNQGGKRKGAMCAYLETWHMDIEEFLELRKNTGDDRRRTHDMHLANWIPDLFMKRVKGNAKWTLFSPHDTPDLHHLSGKAFEAKYEQYEADAKEGKIKHFKEVQALDLWRKMLSMLFETGHPWMTFKDPSNLRSPQDHAGVVHSSNLCTEILLNTSKDETAVCNLGSVNLSKHIKEGGGIDLEKLEGTITSAIRMLDNVIDINYYPTEEAKSSNLKHRPVGMGVMGYMDSLYLQNINICSEQAVQFADESMEAISYYAINASTLLAEEKGKYSSYEGSKWDRGLLPIDTIDLLEEERGVPVKMDRSCQLDWQPVRDRLAKHGMRNSNVMAIAPTATIANIVGVNQSIEPLYKNIFVKSNLSGEFTIANEFLVADLKTKGLWDEEMINDLKYFDGSVQEIDRIPADIKEKYVCAFEVDYEWVIDAASRRQKWIDMGQSLNLYQDGVSGKKLNDMYMHAWEMGLKTTYYLRSMGATRIEKSTLDAKKYGNTIGRKERGDLSMGSSEAKAETAPTPPPKRAEDFDDDCEACQ